MLMKILIKADTGGSWGEGGLQSCLHKRRQVKIHLNLEPIGSTEQICFWTTLIGHVYGKITIPVMSTLGIIYFVSLMRF